MSGDEEYLNVDADGELGTGTAVAAVLESVAEVLRDAPEDYRYDFDLTVEERYQNPENGPSNGGGA